MAQGDFYYNGLIIQDLGQSTLYPDGWHNKYQIVGVECESAYKYFYIGNGIDILQFGGYGDYSAIAGVSNCGYLEKIDIDTTASLISNFSNNINLKEVNFRAPGWVSRYFTSSGIFENCYSLTGFNFQTKYNWEWFNQIIPDYAFRNCYNLNKINIPYNIYSIGSGTFENCSGLNQIIIPNIKKINSNAFKNCSNLTGVYFLSDAPTEIGENIFINSNPNLKIYRYSNTSGWSGTFGGIQVQTIYAQEDNLKYTFDSGNFTYSVNDGSFASGFINIPERYDDGVNGNFPVSGINANAFQNCVNLSGITIGNWITKIPNYAFDSCVNLIEVNLHSSLNSIGDYAFRNCVNLTNINIPSGTRSLGKAVFRNCYSLTGINFIKESCSITGISSYLFDACISLNSIDVSNMKYISSYAFNDCSGLNNIIFGNSNGCSFKMETIGSYAFNNCINLSGIELPDSTKFIEDRAFNNCSSLINPKLGTGISTIGAFVFNGCSNLTGIDIPDNTISIYKAAFKNCTNLQGVNLQWSTDRVNRTLGESLFYNCSSLKEFTLPYSSTGSSIPNNFFYNCFSLETVKNLTKLVSIGDFAFNNCFSLTGLYINFYQDIIKEPSQINFIGLDPDSEIYPGLSANPNCGVQCTLPGHGQVTQQIVAFPAFSSAPLIFTSPDAVSNIPGCPPKISIYPNLNGANVAFHSCGTFTVYINQAGDDYYLPSPQLQVTLRAM